MKSAEIQVGRTYTGLCHQIERKVIGIGDEHRPFLFFGHGASSKGCGVLYEQDGVHWRGHLAQFAQWARSEVK